MVLLEKSSSSIPRNRRIWTIPESSTSTKTEQDGSALVACGARAGKPLGFGRRSRVRSYRRGKAMSKKRISRNAPCPCGSGKKYKNCCYGKGFEWVEDEDGTVGKSIPMTEAVQEVFQQARQAFIDKHGREPEPDELLFTDLPHLKYLEAMVVGNMRAAGLDPAFVHAFEKTGLLVS